MKKVVLLLILLCAVSAHTSHAQNSSKCISCNGSGRQVCIMCGGSGMTVTYSYFGLQYNYCSFCCGTGGATCMVCSGTGRIIIATPPVTVPVYIPSGSTSTTNHDGHSHQNDSSSNPKTCMHCYGDGKCSTCLGRGSYTSFGNTVLCPNCERNHNGICSYCHGRGKIY